MIIHSVMLLLVKHQNVFWIVASNSNQRVILQTCFGILLMQMMADGKGKHRCYWQSVLLNWLDSLTSYVTLEPQNLICFLAILHDGPTQSRA